MAIGLTAAMTTAKASLLAQQEALTITSNNIANANKSSYHRQTVNFSDNVEILDNTGYYGTGVSVSSITRAYNSALENSLSGANTNDGYNQTFLDYSSQVESLLAPEGESSMITDVSSFMAAMQDVETSPEDTTYRNAFISAAKTLANTMNSNYSSLSTIRNGLASSSNALGGLTGGTAKNSMDDANTIIEQIADMNEQISSLETNSSNKSIANDLRDQRDEFVHSLSNYMSISVTEDAYSRYTITSVDSSGNSFNILYVSGTGPSNYRTQINDLTGVVSGDTLSFQVTDNSEATPTIHTLSNSGELGAYSDSFSYISDEMRKVYNPDYDSADPDTYPGYAQAIAEKTNAILETGYDLNDNTGAANDLFVNLTGSYSGSVMTVVKGYAASQVAASDSIGNQGNGDNMANLWNYFQNSDASSPTQIYSGFDPSTGLETGENTTLSSYSNSYVNAIAAQVASAATSASTSASTVTMYKNAIANASGVSSDTELTNMLAIQQAYAASAKIVSTIQAMYDAILGTV